MKNTFALILVLISITTFGQWEWQFPNPHGNTINDVTSISDTGFRFVSNYYTLASGSKVDSTYAWQIMEYPESYYNLNAIHFFNQDYGFIAGDSGLIFKYDAGSIEAEKTGTIYNFRAMDFFESEDNGIAVGYKGIIFKRYDTVWQKKNSGTIDIFYDVTYANSTNIIAVGDSGLVVRSTDAGETWTQVTSGTNQPLYGVDFPSADIGYAAGKKGKIIKSEDGGATWSNISYQALETRYLAVDFYNDTSGYVCGDNGTVIVTHDGGASWFYLGYNNPISLTWCKMINNEVDTLHCGKGVFFGEYGKMLETDTCGGWVEQNHASHYSLSAMAFNDSEFTIAVGGDPFNNKPYILGTDEAGSITPLKIDTIKRYVSDVSMLDENIGYICGFNGKVYKADSAAYNWVPLTTGINKNLYSIKAFNQNQVFAAGLNGTLIKTIQGDTIWDEIETGVNNHLFGMEWLNSDTGFAFGFEGVLIRILNQGNSIKKLTSGTWNHIYDMDFVNPQEAYIVGSGGIIRRILFNEEYEVDTSFTILSGFNLPINKIQFTSSSTGYITGNNGLILKTTDGGLSWLPLHTRTSNHLRTIHFVNNFIGYVGGEGVSILKTSDGGGPVITPGIAERKQEIESPFTIYPNPSAGDLNISFELNQKAFVHVSMFDLSGRLIDVIEHREFYNGNQSIQKNISHLPKGTYILVMGLDDFFFSEKLILVE